MGRKLRAHCRRRVVRALENRTRSSTLSIGAGLIRRTPGIVVSQAFWAFPASDCRLGSSVGFGTGTRMAPKKNLRALRVTCRERAALLRPRVPRRAVLAQTRGTRLWDYWYVHKIPLSPRGTWEESWREGNLNYTRLLSPALCSVKIRFEARPKSPDKARGQRRLQPSRVAVCGGGLIRPHPSYPAGGAMANGLNCPV
jgi:hypothetical protein